MSRQSKNAKKKLIAKQFTEIRKSGGHGPEKTKAVHGKVNVNRKKGVLLKKNGKPTGRDSPKDVPPQSE